MLCSWFEGQILGFLHRSVKAMGCFFGCFRIRDDHRPPTHLVSEPAPYNSREPVVSRNRNRLSSLLLSEAEETDSYPSKDKETRIQGNTQADIDVGELKDEAKFLKACGTLSETPGEIRKASAKLKDSTAQDEDLDTKKFHSWLPGTSMQKFNLDTEPDQPPTPIKDSEGLAKDSSYSDFTPSGVTNTVGNEQRINKSVRFECNSDASSASSKNSTGIHESAANRQVSKNSPNPTPLKLSNDLHTPGTVFPSYLENGKNPRIRSQYVYPVHNPVENMSQWNVAKEKDSESDSNVGVKLPDLPSEPEVLKVEESLSSWLKPRVIKDSEKVGSGKSNEDRPILGMVAAHWNEAEASHVSPKWWDGNGIPNSTTKYKEDQKVSWHATPFEERLEKALSEETFISKRRNISGTQLVNFDETEECDTALSQLQSSSSTHLNSVVSC